MNSHPADRDRLAKALRIHPAVLGFVLLLAEDAGARKVGGCGKTSAGKAVGKRFLP